MEFNLVSIWLKIQTNKQTKSHYTWLSINQEIVRDIKILTCREEGKQKKMIQIIQKVRILLNNSWLPEQLSAEQFISDDMEVISLELNLRTRKGLVLGLYKPSNQNEYRIQHFELNANRFGKTCQIIW